MDSAERMPQQITRDSFSISTVIIGVKPYCKKTLTIFS